METYPVKIAELLDSLGSSMPIADSFTLPSLDVGDEHFEMRGPVTFEVTVANTGTAVIAYGRVSAPVVAQCRRCLCDFDTVIEGDVEGFYVYPGADDDIPEEQDVEYIDPEGVVDIMPALMSVLVLEAPFAPLHDEECAGICTQCGTDLNTGTCTCDCDAGPDHPFAALRALAPDGNAAD